MPERRAGVPDRDRRRARRLHPGRVPALLLEIPNVTRIIACMKRERPKLSPACAAFFNARAGAPQTATRSIGAPNAN